MKLSVWDVAGPEGVEDGGAVHFDGPVCDGGHAAAAGVPLPRLAVRHRAGCHHPHLPPWHLPARAVSPSQSLKAPPPQLAFSWEHRELAPQCCILASMYMRLSAV